MRLISTCPICKAKNVTEKSHSTIGKTRFITLDCGHTYTEKLLVGKATAEPIEGDEIFLADGRKLYPFQVTGIRFAEQSNFKCLIADEMGLGKSIQAIAAIDAHFDELKPILIICKASLTHNWLREFVSGTKRIAQVFESGDRIIPGIGVVIVSFDTLTPRKIRGEEFKVDDSNLRVLKVFDPKTLILDEVQMVKSHTAKRTNALRELARSN